MIPELQVQARRAAPVFTIVTATFNASTSLDRTISSLRAQTRKSFQWIVIDGGSGDDTVSKIEQARELVDQWVSEPDRGIADAWNKGLARASGTHVLILNAGDTYDPSMLEIMAERCNGEVIACAHARLLAEDGRTVGLFRAQPHKLCRAMHVPHSWCAVPLALYRTLGPYRNLPLAMDFDWFHRYYRRFGVAGFAVVDRILGSYYLGGKSDTSYTASFKSNERILVENGSSVLLARFYRLTYSLKHVIRRALVNQV
jgi:glycosyltransferase involved in cell wall biosynthesis